MEEFVKSFSPLEIVEQGLDGHTGRVLKNPPEESPTWIDWTP